MKYVTSSIAGIITQIAHPTDVEGYTIGVLECFLPDNEELKRMTAKERNKWIRENNARMRAICKFLNEREKEAK